MSIFPLHRRRHSRGRIREILGVFARHGLGHAFDGVRLGRIFRWHARGGREEAVGSLRDMAAVARRVCDAFQELGPTFVKLGQILSSRPDLIPPEFIVEFRKLQDKVAPFDSAQAFLLIEEALGRPVGEIFEHIDDEPIAAGSIAQVYHATLRNGDDVVVKVKRPDVDKIIMGDIAVLRKLAALVERHVPEIAVFQPEMLVDEFEQTVRRELDFVNEASNTAQFHAQFGDRTDVRAPKVCWEETTASVLVLERLKGANIGDFARLDRLGLCKKDLASRLIEVFMHQFFETGLFHADPHPGNILVDEEGNLALVDFGMVGRLDEDLKSHLVGTLMAVAGHDVDIIIDIYLELGVIPADVRVEDLRYDLHALMDKYYGIPIRLIDARSVLFEVIALARRYRIVLPREFVLLGKSFATIAGLAQALDPDINISEIVRPYARRLMADRFNPKRVLRSVSATAWQVRGLLRSAPHNLRVLLRKLARGELGLQLRHTGLEDLPTELDRMSNRLAFSIVTAAIIVTSGMLLDNKVGPQVFGLSLIGVVGYFVAGVLGLYLLIAILRRGRL